jgi:dihydroorotate dehydrogenase (fumarate)
MPDLKANYMGLQLKNPVIVGSSTLTDTPQKIKALEECGAAAVVLKSLFEEEVRTMSNASKCCNYHPEAYYYDMSDASMLYGISEYLQLIRDAKATCNIPVIASICCENAEWWASYPERLQKAGADAIELNINMISIDASKSPADTFQDTKKIIETVKKNISIPFSVKLSPYCCSIPNLAKTLKNSGAAGIVLFSRLFRMGINLESFECEPASYYSSPSETYKVLRWINIVAEQVDVDICANTGIHSSKEVIQHLLAGASAVQMVSSIYQNGPEVITTVLQELEQYMYDRSFADINEMKGFLRSKEKDFDKLHFNSLTCDKFQLGGGWS